ncbi:hypothetical protein ACH5RR_010903 [Cinchona calisaya]|uniref:U5 small nuclear ribonucleoprotein TSSC4 n=1 Tax=Cinchona calisaya TaxID=153742 RepID=A0ABD3A700_9GENT
MEDTFRVRVDKVFGSLTSSSSSDIFTPSSSSSLWSLSNEEIERKEWKRHSPPDQQPTPLQLHSDLQELNDQQITQEQDWDIRSTIGLDCTLDFEEEEDEHDKVATGREEAGALLYMCDIVDYGIGVNAHNELPSSFAEATRDPRANHMAAKLRLREDAETAGNFDTLKLSEIYAPSLTNAQSNVVDDTIIPKPILKKREKPMDEKSPKRVRFHKQSLGPKDSSTGSCSVEETSTVGAFDLPDSLSSGIEAKAADQDSSLPQKSSSNEESAVLEDSSSLPKVCTSVPDYLRNPTRYTRYNLDSSNDMDDESNRKAYMEFLNQLKKPRTADLQLDDSSVSFQHSLTFTPKKKRHDSSLVKDNEFKQYQGEISKEKPFPVGIAAGDAQAQDGEVCAMEEDAVETVVGKYSHKPGRQYRTRSKTDMDSDDHET